MGRTNPTYRDTVRRQETHWQEFRTALRRRNRTHFDRLWTHAADYADAGGYQNHDAPMETILLSIVLAQERRIAALEAAVGGERGETVEAGRSPSN